MQIRLICELQNVVKRIPWGGNLGIDTKNTYVSDFDKKLEHFVCFLPGICAFLAIIILIYANLYKLDTFMKFFNQLRQSPRNETP